MKIKNLVTILVCGIALLSLVGCQSPSANEAAISQASSVANNNIQVFPVGISENGDVNAFIVKNGQVYWCRYQNIPGNVVTRRVDLKQQ